ncbi:MAG: MFS transporter [Bacteroidales bacterium]|jgi:fucose permease|nr:MFS transporter [Bacteroidales bacterium]MDD3101279.1 MFS transporter [Bacteroidales bacterium]MDD3944437.1 MFS transporter [Bacteroidales bacterium]MDD4479904.1 MFS transporter [Bacteroidales bacterium]MDD5315279.1 MFS transporter [Bacteroidales bacterium]
MALSEKRIKFLIPIMLAFFVMGFVDMVGTATNYVKADFNLSDTMANFLPSMVFFWFLLFSVPTSLLQHRIGKRKTVLLSLVVTLLALALPVVSYSYPIMLVSFSLLGIGNTLMQVSLNPLISCVVSNEKLASTLTFGQFIKAIASFIAPILASWAAIKFNNWMLLFPIFIAVSITATLFMGLTKIKEDEINNKSLSMWGCISLLKNKIVLLFFLGIVCHVGIDVGTNTAAPKIIMERLAIPLDQAMIATSVYFLFRTIGCLTGSFFLAHMPIKKFFAISVLTLVLGITGLFIMNNLMGLYIAIGLIGFGNSNVFSMVFSSALLSFPDKKNEMSGLMIMGLIGGTIFPLFMGLLSDALQSQLGSIVVIGFGVAYLVVMSIRFYKVKLS